MILTTLLQLLIFFIKVVIIVASVLIVIIIIFALASKGKQKGKISITKLSDYYKDLTNALQKEILNKKDYKELKKSQKKSEKKEKKTPEKTKKIFVMDFDGDIRASAVSSLKEEVTAILNVASTQDEVVLRLESGGGIVSNYGLGASQLQRIKDRRISLTVIVDKIAASGGYMMACVGNKVLSAPFAIIGSIGVLAQLPNFNRLLKKHNIDFEQITAGKYKRTLTLFGENTKEAREKCREEIEEAHQLFKEFVSEHRPQIDVEKLSTGEYWLGKKSLELGLVDGLKTSDDYLLEANKTANIYKVKYLRRKKFFEKIVSSAQSGIKSFIV